MFSHLKKIDGKKLLKDIIFRMKDDDVLALGSQLAYSLVLAFFPFLIFLLTLVGYSPISTQQVITELNRLFPKEVYKLIEKTVKEVYIFRSGSLMSFSFIAMLFTSSSGFGAVMKGLNKAYDEKENRSALNRQLLSIFFTIGISIILIFSIVLLVFGEVNGKMISNWLSLGIKFSILWNILRYIFMLIAMTCIFILMYKYTPSKKLNFKEVIPGAIFTTVGWVIASQIFSFYIENFGNYSRVYGSIGAVIIMLTWVFIMSVILLLGGEINASMIMLWKKKLN